MIYITEGEWKHVPMYYASELSTEVLAGSTRVLSGGY